MLEKSKLLEINRAMLGLGAPVVTDGAGYSQAHYPSMSNLAYKDDLTDAEAYRVASVLMNYTKTQLTQYAADIKESLDVYGKAVKELKVVDYDRKVVKLSWAFNRNISLFIKSSFDKKYFRWTKDNEWVLNLKWDGFDILITEFDAEGFDTTNVKMIRDNLDDCAALLQMVQGEVRDIIGNINIRKNASEEQLDLIEALQRQITSFKKFDPDCYIQMTIHGAENLPASFENFVREMQILRIFQESLTNIRRHSEATRVEIELRYESGALSDDGVGFDATASESHYGGMAIMRERAEAIGAALTVNSAPGEGTTVALALPYGTEMK